ncbi:hypothetical protein MBANPS3_001566, partial [Mucor bainieri]
IYDKLPTVKQRIEQPDVNDPNNYCCCCDKTLSTRHGYRRHLLHVHSIFQKQAPKKDELLPDVYDPNYHCRVCQKKYLSKSSYREHLRFVHQMKLTPLKNRRERPTLLPAPNDPNYYCRVCDVTKKSRESYRRHCKRVHFMELDHRSIKNSNAEININSPDWYCAQCEHNYSKRYFKLHLRAVHGISV